MADEIDVEEDRGRGFSMASNDLRLHWLLRSVTRNRLSLNERSAVYVAACQSASLGWLASFADSAWVKKFATAFTAPGWSQGLGELGDLVARRTTKAQVKGWERLMNVAEFRRRVEEVSVAGDSPDVSEFLDAWRRQERGEDE